MGLAALDFVFVPVGIHTALNGRERMGIGVDSTQSEGNGLGMTHHTRELPHNRPPSNPNTVLTWNS